MKNEKFTLDPKPFYNRHRNTVLRVSMSETKVKFIPLNVVLGLSIEELSISKFNDEYKEIPNYPVQRAIDLFVGYAKTLGANKATIEVLRKISKSPSNDDDLNEADKKAGAREEVKPTKPAKEAKPIKPTKEAKPTKPAKEVKLVKPTVEVEPTKPTKPAKEIKPTKPTKPTKPAKEIKPTKLTKETKPTTGEYKSAAAMFQALIMAHQLTDNEIFDAVKQKFGLPEEKRGYVKWYRYDLKRKGKNPPDEVIKK